MINYAKIPQDQDLSRDIWLKIYWIIDDEIIDLIRTEIDKIKFAGRGWKRSIMLEIFLRDPGTMLLVSFFPENFTKPPQSIPPFNSLLGNMCGNAESYIAWIVIETIGPENGCERDSYSPHFITN